MRTDDGVDDGVDDDDDDDGDGDGDDDDDDVRMTMIHVDQEVVQDDEGL